RLQLGHMIATFDTSMGMSLSMMPPWVVALVARWCFLATFTPSTMTRLRDRSTRVISPCFPTSLPERTITRSPFLSLSLISAISEHLGGEGHDAHEPP